MARGARRRARGPAPSSPRRSAPTPRALTRVLRGLALEDVVEERDGRFALTPIGEQLEPHGRRRCACAGRSTTRRGGPARRGARRRDGVRARVRRVVLRSPRRPPGAGGRVPGLDGGPLGAGGGRRRRRLRLQRASASLVDVGGGRGILLRGDPRRARRTCKATLVDRAGAVAAAREHARRRAACVEGDFFDALPRGRGRLPALARPARLGRRGPRAASSPSCRAAMPAARRACWSSTRSCPERAKDLPFAIRMDLHMLLLLGARERTEAEFRALLAAAGFEVRRVVPTGSPAGLSVIEAAQSALSIPPSTTTRRRSCCAERGEASRRPRRRSPAARRSARS